MAQVTPYTQADIDAALAHVDIAFAVALALGYLPTAAQQESWAPHVLRVAAVAYRVGVQTGRDAREQGTDEETKT